MPIKFLSLLALVFQMSLPSHASINGWSPLPQQVVDDLNQQCAANGLDRAGQGLGAVLLMSAAVTGYFFLGFASAAGDPRDRGVIDGSAVLAGMSTILLGAGGVGLILLPFSKEEYMGLIDDLQNGLQTPRVETLRQEVEKKGIFFDEGLEILNRLILEGKAGCFQSVDQIEKFS